VVETPIDDTSERQDVSISTDLLTRSLWAKPMHDNQMSMNVSSSVVDAADKAFLDKFAGNPIDNMQKKCHVLVVLQYFDCDAPILRWALLCRSNRPAGRHRNDNGLRQHGRPTDTHYRYITVPPPQKKCLADH
jgi:hypothetical protein